MHRLLSVPLLLFLCVAPVQADDETTMVASGFAYINSATMPRYTDFCSKYVPQYREFFDIAFPAWLSAWKAYIDRGRVLVEEDSAKEGHTAQQDLDSAAEIMLKQVSALSDDRIEKQCRAFLNLLEHRPPPEKP